MQQSFKTKSIIFIMTLLFIAGILDMKYKGRFYRLLQTFQND
ncbi:hypothetical protein [Virgibacillus saliphilus]|nr:hypothetical protein [Virgibacillus sp. NKC19-3]